MNTLKSVSSATGKFILGYIAGKILDYFWNLNWSKLIGAFIFFLSSLIYHKTKEKNKLVGKHEKKINDWKKNAKEFEDKLKSYWEFVEKIEKETYAWIKQKNNLRKSTNKNTI